jgi:hypothetical protein
MLDSRHSADDGDEIPPALLLGSKRLLALRSQTVISPPALLGLLHPSSLEPAFLLQSMEQRIE